MSDPLEQLERTAELLPTAAAGVRLGERANRHLQRFADATRQERRLVALAGLARLFGGATDTQVKAHVSRAFECAAEAAECMQDVEDEDSLEDAVTAFQTYAQSIGMLEGAVRPVWLRVIEQQFAQLASVGELLKEFPGARDLGERMVEAAAEAQRHAQTSPVDLVPVAKRLLDTRTTLVAEQQSVAGDPRVAAFLQALAADRATLDLLETEVLDWLKSQGALTSLKVTAA